MEHSLKIIAHIHSDFPTKFGIPRQSGLVAALRATVVFEPEYRTDEALRGIEDFSHLWLIWEFSEAKRGGFAPTVRPPRLGGDTRMGVFASRSPFRPNSLGLSCVRLEEVRRGTSDGTVLIVSGADLMDGTPIFDVKPYLPYADAHPEARGGFAQLAPEPLKVQFPQELLEIIPPEQRAALLGVLAQDPRPAYQNDPSRIYGMRFGQFDIRFTVDGAALSVREVAKG